MKNKNEVYMISKTPPYIATKIDYYALKRNLKNDRLNDLVKSIILCILYIALIALGLYDLTSVKESKADVSPKAKITLREEYARLRCIFKVHPKPCIKRLKSQKIK